MTEFLAQIKSNPELNYMFENVQKDAASSGSDTSLMETNYGDSRGAAGVTKREF
jgi:hypothetical protein